MTRVSENQIINSLMSDVLNNRHLVNRFSKEISTGYAVQEPGDTNVAGTISQYQLQAQRIEGYRNRIANVTSMLSFQDDILTEANDLMIRAKEIATQAANETNTPSDRELLSEEVFQLRDHLVNLANSTFRGKYIYGGNDDDDPPYDAAAYTSPATGDSSQRYVYDSDPGYDGSRSVQITDSMTIRVNTPGENIFDTAIQSLERLGRTLDGYQTTLDANGVPTGAGNAYTFPDDTALQTTALQNILTSLDSARTSDIIPEQSNVAGRMKRLQAADSLLELNKTSTEDVLDKLQYADIIESASNLSLAQTALNASMNVSSRVMQQSILDYL